jgi:hypothetical protein
MTGGLFKGTVSAGDGIVFEITKPKADQVNGDVSSFFTPYHADSAHCARKTAQKIRNTLRTG